MIYIRQGVKWYEKGALEYRETSISCVTATGISHRLINKTRVRGAHVGRKWLQIFLALETKVIKKKACKRVVWTMVVQKQLKNT